VKSYGCNLSLHRSIRAGGLDLPLLKIDPLRILTHKNTQWKWATTEIKAFNTLKDKLTTSAMTYFNPSLHTQVIVDASPVGLGAIFISVVSHFH
jgi:hypothetical protein